MKRKTSFSLPKKILKKVTIKNMPKNQLVLLCIEKLLKDLTIVKKSDGQACSYNSDRCSEKLYIYLTNEQHRFLRSLRLLQNKSVSLIICEAITRYAKRILKKHNQKVVRAPLKFHLKLKFQHQSLIGMSIVMLSPD